MTRPYPRAAEVALQQLQCPPRGNQFEGFDASVAVLASQACAQLREFIQSRLLHGVSGRSGDDAALRAGLASSMLVGIVTSRRIIGVPVLVDADTEKLVATVAPAIQQILVGAPSQTGGIEKGTGA